MTLTPQEQDLIDRYITLLKTYNEHTNIYSKGAYPLLDFHIRDSLTLSQIIPKNAVSLIDMGSGSGLPSIPLAILRPNLLITAVESKSRKTRFLEEAKVALSLENFRVEQSDINEFAHKLVIRPDIITAKAFAPWDKASLIAEKIAKKGTHLLIPISGAQKATFQAEKKRNFKIISDFEPFFYIHKTY